MPEAIQDVELAKTEARILDRLNTLSNNQIASGSQMERLQYEALLTEALELSRGNYACMLSPAGRGAYAQQFIILTASVERNPLGDIIACHDSLHDRRQDPLVSSVLRQGRIVYGKPTDIGLPHCLPASHPTIRHYVLLPIELDLELTSVLFVANTEASPDQTLIDRLEKLNDTFKGQFRPSAVVPSVSAVKRSKKEDASRHYVQLMNSSLNAVVTVNERGDITAFNPAAELLFGRSSTLALGKPINRFVSHSYIVPILKQAPEFDNDHVSNGKVLNGVRSIEGTHENGQSLQLTASAYYTRIDHQVFITLLFAEQAISSVCSSRSADQQQFRLLTNLAPVGILQLNTDWTCDYANDMWSQLSGLTTEESIGEGWVDAIHAEDIVDSLVELREALSRREIFTRDLRLHKPTGKICWVNLSATVTINEKDSFSGCLLVLLDITDKQQVEQKLRFAAQHDMLTGLANRPAFLDQLQERLNGDTTRRRTALLYLDLDGFKSINDNLGHDCGDELLRQFADRLRTSLGVGDYAARLGGDEFTAIVDTAGGVDDICARAEHIVRTMRTTFEVFDNEIFLSVSIGIALAEDDAITSDELIKQADLALYRAKSSGRSRWVVFNSDFYQEDKQRSALESQLRIATERQEFSLAFQPQCNIANGELVGIEALLRWDSNAQATPNIQMVVQLLEETGLINDVGQWVLESACEQFMRWKRANVIVADCSLSVNVSVSQLNLANFVTRVERIIGRSGMNPSDLVLELTESTLIDKNSNYLRIINSIKEIGVKISLDDFGTGYASLSYLTRLPIDHLKIDRSFVMSMENEEVSHTIVLSILALAKAMNLSVVAEGIEQESTLKILADAQCEIGQGFYFSKPKSASDFELWLSDWQLTQSKKHPAIA